MKMMNSSTEAWSVQFPARMKVNEEKNRALGIPSSKGLTLALFRECDCRLITKHALSPFVLTASHKINIIIFSLLTEVLRLVKDRESTVIPQSRFLARHTCLLALALSMTMCCFYHRSSLGIWLADGAFIQPPGSPHKHLWMSPL